MSKVLHITSGDSLNDRLSLLGVEGHFAVWREMLCEGKTVSSIGSPEFKEARKAFLKEVYDLDTSFYEERFGGQIDIIAAANNYYEVVLWFEYDLFCHINLLAAISYLESISYQGSLYLVCSGRIKGEPGLFGLSELNEDQLLEHYKQKKLLPRKTVRLLTEYGSFTAKKIITDYILHWLKILHLNFYQIALAHTKNDSHRLRQVSIQWKHNS
jgi:hypothetical protein